MCGKFQKRGGNDAEASDDPEEEFDRECRSQHEVPEEASEEATAGDGTGRGAFMFATSVDHVFNNEYLALPDCVIANSTIGPKHPELCEDGSPTDVFRECIPAGNPTIREPAS